MKKIVSFFLLTMWGVLVGKVSCALPEEMKLTVACTTKCPSSYINALKASAKQLHYNLKIVTLNNSTVEYKKILGSVDGILSPGGHDIQPKYFNTIVFDKQAHRRIDSLFKKYGKTSRKGRLRDAFEYALFQYYFSNERYSKLPILGVCYGMQMLASALYVPLYVDIKEEIGVSARRKVNDKVVFIKATEFSKFVDKKYLLGYKNHHQAINLNFFKKYKRLGFYKRIIISAVSNKGKIAEIMEYKGRPILGIQFHAERSVKATKEAVYHYFLINSCLYKRSKKVF